MPVASAPASVQDSAAITSTTASLPPPAPIKDMATPAPVSNAYAPTPGSNLSNPNFVRGIYVDGVSPSSPLRSADGIKKLVADCRNTGFDTIFAQVRVNGNAFYNSTLAPMASGLPQGFDPLKTLIAEARAGDRPLKVHALIVLYRVWGGSLDSAPDNHVVKKHPEWLTQTDNGVKEVRLVEAGGQTRDEYWLDPGLTAVQDHLAAVATELAKNYDVDGIQLDRARYPDLDRTSFPEGSKRGGYNPQAVERFNREKHKAGPPAFNDPEWAQWRRDQVTATVKKIREAVRVARPSARISATAVTYGTPPADKAKYLADSAPYNSVLQDWVGWCEQGLLDYCSVMNYKSAARNAADFEQWTDFAFQNKGQAKMLIAVGAYLNPPKYTLAMTLEPLFDTRADGVAIYSYTSPADQTANYQDAFTLLKTAFDPIALSKKMTQVASVTGQLRGGSGADALKRLNQLSIEVTGSAPAIAGASPPAAGPAVSSLPALPVGGATAQPSPAAITAQPSPATLTAGEPPSLTSAMGATVAVPSPAAATGPSLSSITNAPPGSIPPSLPVESIPPTPSSIAAASGKELPSLSSLNISGEKTPAASAGQSGISMPSLSAITPAAGQTNYTGSAVPPPLSEAVTARGTIATNAPEENATPESSSMPPITAATAGKGKGRTARAVGAPKKTEVADDKRGTDMASGIATPVAQKAAGQTGGSSPFDLSLSSKVAAQSRPAIPARTSINIPDYGASTNYTGEPMAGGAPAVPTFVAPSVLTPVTGAALAQGTMPSMMTGNREDPAKAPVVLPPDYSDQNSPYGKTEPAQGLRYYGGSGRMRSIAPSRVVASAGQMQVIVLTTGKEFVGRIIERGAQVKVQLPNGSTISVPANKIASVRTTSGAPASSGLDIPVAIQ